MASASQSSTTRNQAKTLGIVVADPQTQLIIEAVNKKTDEVRTEVKTLIRELKTELNETLKVHDDRICTVEAKQTSTDAKVEELQKLISEQNTRMKEQDDIIARIMNQGNDRESHGRRNNLIFTGIDELPNEKKDQTLAALEHVFTDTLKLDENTVNGFIYRDYHRLGRGKVSTRKEEVPTRQDGVPARQTYNSAAIIVAFVRQTDRDLVFSRAKKLKNTNITMRPDLPAHLSTIRNNLLSDRKAIKEVNKNILAMLQYRAYKPVLIVKYRGRLVKYDKLAMPINELELEDQPPDSPDSETE